MNKGLGYCAVMLLAGGFAACNDSGSGKENKEDTGKKTEQTETKIEEGTVSCPKADFFGCAKTSTGLDVVLECAGNKVAEKTVCTQDQKCLSEQDGDNISSIFCVYDMPESVKSICNDKSKDDYYCALEGSDSWVVYCADGKAWQTSSDKCSARNLTCGAVKYDDWETNDCICSRDEQCPATVEHSRGKCDENKKCSFECLLGYHQIFDGNDDICEEDSVFPDEVAQKCDGTNDEHSYCVTVGNDVWGVYCENGAVSQEYTEKCGGQKPYCGEIQYVDFTFNECAECVRNEDCEERWGVPGLVCNTGHCME